MKKWRGSLLIVILFGILFVGIPLALFSTLSGTFTPPAPDSLQAQVPSLPYPMADAVPAPPQASDSENLVEEEGQRPDHAPDSETAAASEVLDDKLVAELIAAFQERQPSVPGRPAHYYQREDVPEAFIDMALAVLQGLEPDDSLLVLIRHPKPSVRMAAIDALLTAQDALMAEGTPAMIQLLARTKEDDLNRLVRSATETLIADTQAGRTSNAQMLLLFLGDYAQPAVAHLAWASRNHPDADMRAWTMNVAFMLNPQSDQARDVIRRGLSDPCGSVRIQALQALLTRPLAEIGRDIGKVPPTYLERRPSDGLGGSVTADVPLVPTEKSAPEQL